MFLRLHQSQHDFKDLQPLSNAQLYINDAKSKALPYSQSGSRDERCSFLCGNAGIYCVAAVISSCANNLDEMKKDLDAFESGFEACKPIRFSRYGSDEILGLTIIRFLSTFRRVSLNEIIFILCSGSSRISQWHLLAE